MRLRRGRFAEVISRQLEIFAEDEAALIEECRERELAYGRTGRDDAEEAYGDYMDAVDAAVDALAEMRDRFATTLPEADAVTVYPPVPLGIARVADVERMQMLVESPSRAALQRFLGRWLTHLHELRHQRKEPDQRILRWAVDVDPLTI